MGITEDVQKALWMLQDLPYREFQSGLIPTVPKNTVIGVRMPELQKLAKRFMLREDLHEFLEALPHAYFDENNLHAYIIGRMSEYDSCVSELKRFLPYVDNWATCDCIRPKCFENNPDRLLREIEKWVLSDEPYTVRFGLEMLMLWFLDENYKPEYLQLAASVQSDEYYVNMMQAWFFATALTKRYETAKYFFTDHLLAVWVHNKAIQKAIESRCFSSEQKTYLRTLKRKK